MAGIHLAAHPGSGRSTAARGVLEEERLGSSLIVPAGTVVRFVGAVFQDGELHVKTAVTAPATPRKMAGSRGTFKAMGTPSDSVSFEPAGGVGCLRRKQNSTAHYDPCQQFWRATNDNNMAREWFASEMHGTGKSHSVWRLQGLEVDSRRSKNTALQEWVNWDPGADAPGNCRANGQRELRRGECQYLQAPLRDVGHRQGH